MQREAVRIWVGLKELVSEQGPIKIALLLEGQSQLLEMMAPANPLATVLDALARVVEAQLEGAACALLLLARDGKHLHLTAAPSLPESYARALDGSEVGPGAGWCGMSAFEERPVIVADIAHDPIWGEHRAPALAAGFQACWSVPVFSGRGGVLGTLALYHRAPFSPAAIHLGLITLVTRLARIAIERDTMEHERERLWNAERFAERYQMVLRATREAVWDWDLSTGIVLWNEGLKAFGYQPSDPPSGLGWWFERIHPHDAGRVRDEREQALADPQRAVWEGEYRFRRHDGRYADVVDRALIARSDEGQALRMVGSIQDITRRKRQAVEIQRLAERLRATTAAASVGTWQLEPPTDLFRADASLNRLMGREPRDTVESFDDALKRIHPDDRRRVIEARDDALASGGRFSVEHRIVLQDGEIRWLRSRGRVFHDGGGNAETIAGAVADITDLKRAELSMGLLADASRLLSESLDVDQVLDVVAHMAIPTFADGAMVHMRDVATGEPRLISAHAADPELESILCDVLRSGTFQVGSPARRVLRTGRSELHAGLTAEWLTTEEVDENVIGLVRRFHVSSVVLVAILLAGRPVGVIVFWSTGTRHFRTADVAMAEELARRAASAIHNADLLATARRERGRSEEAMALRERLLAIVGHDLRNPLSAIAVAAQVLARRALPPAEAALVKRIDGSAARMTRLIGQILDFARVRQGTSLPIDLHPADLHQICRGVVEELRLANPQREIVLDLDGDGRAVCDPDRIAEAISNLVGNAIQHGADGPVRVGMRDEPPDRVAIEVHNPGAIPREMQATIFEAYRREPTEASHRSKSIGLGLFIANEIVKAHGGVVALSSSAINGTTFTVLLARHPRTA